MTEVGGMQTRILTCCCAVTRGSVLGRQLASEVAQALLYRLNLPKHTTCSGWQ